MDTLKAILLIPLLLGGAVAMTLLSYMVVPIVIIGFVLLIALTVNGSANNIKKGRVLKDRKKRDKRRAKAWKRKKRLGY